MNKITERVKNGYRNVIEISICEGGTVIDHSGITRCQLSFDGQLIDSAVNPSYFDLTKIDRIILNLGGAGLTPKTYAVDVIIFDISSALGFFVDKFIMTVS